MTTPRNKPRQSTRPTGPVSDVRAMERAVRSFLVGAGLDPAERPELAQTPELVARAWSEEFLEGYRSSPAEALAERMPAPGSELVVLEGIDYQSVCPHHLLPYGGVAHLGYVPGRWVVGFGQLVRLVDLLGHRLVLQEELAGQIAAALVDELGARAAGVILEAEQSCMTLRGERRPRARVVTEAFAGSMRRDAELRGRFLRALKKR